jgi:hypothetical protein
VRRAAIVGQEAVELVEPPEIENTLPAKQAGRNGTRYGTHGRARSAEVLGDYRSYSDADGVAIALGGCIRNQWSGRLSGPQD